MLERTFSFWRRWVGPPDESEGGTATAVAERKPTERRLFVRYPSDLQADVQLLDHDGAGKTSAQLRDISRGGANIVLDQELDPGQLLNIELPRADDPGTQTVLACVVRAQEEPDGRWALGCVFSRELSEEDLAGCGAGQSEPHADDKRIRRRFDCHFKAQIQKVTEPGASWHEVQVLNLSASGIGLVIDRYIDAGALLNVELLRKDGALVRTILACVVHVAERDGNQWALGCNFIRELNEEDFQALI